MKKYTLYGGLVVISPRLAPSGTFCAMGETQVAESKVFDIVMNGETVATELTWTEALLTAKAKVESAKLRPIAKPQTRPNYLTVDYTEIEKRVMSSFQAQAVLKKHRGTQKSSRPTGTPD